MPILWVFKPTFSLFRKAFCYIKRRKSFFLHLFSGSMTWDYRGYRGLQGVTKGDRGWQGVTGNYKGLQRVTRGYRGLQGVTKGYRVLQKIIETYFWLERSQLLFLGLFCRKIKVEQISNFWRKRLTNPFGKMLILRFS